MAGDERPDAMLELAINEAWRTLDAQREHQGELQGRTNALLGLAALVVGLMTSNLFPADSTTAPERLAGRDAGRTLEWWALGGLALLVVCAVFNNWPRHWKFNRRPAVFEWYWENGHGHDVMLAGLYEDAKAHFLDNLRRLHWMEWAHRLAVLCFGLVSVFAALAIIKR